MPQAPSSSAATHALNRQRMLLLLRLKRWLDPPMAVLGLAWLVLLVIDLLRGLDPLLQTVSNAIWAVFVIDFVVEFALAPRKLPYLRHHWLTALSLLAPALRFLRIARLARVVRSLRVARELRLLRIVSSVNRGTAALARHMGRRGFAYVLALTLVVTLAGSAGMYAFEHNLPGGQGLNTFGSAVWWTAMIMTTMGSAYWPETPEGRVLCFLLALYAFAVFGYVTAALASFFVGRDAANPQGELPNGTQIEQVLRELKALREDLQRLRHESALSAGATAVSQPAAASSPRRG
jgi:voltage-gated potassium channel